MSDVRKRFGMLFQGAALFDSMNVAENVGFAFRKQLRATTSEIARKVAEALSLQARPIDVRAHSIETIVLVNDVHQGTMQMISFAKSLGKPWVAVHVAVRPSEILVKTGTTTISARLVEGRFPAKGRPARLALAADDGGAQGRGVPERVRLVEVRGAHAHVPRVDDGAQHDRHRRRR